MTQTCSSTTQQQKKSSNVKPSDYTDHFELKGPGTENVAMTLPRPDYYIIQGGFYSFHILVVVPLTLDTGLATVPALTPTTLGIGSYNFLKVGNGGNKNLVSCGYIQSCLEIFKDGGIVFDHFAHLWVILIGIFGVPAGTFCMSRERGQVGQFANRPFLKRHRLVHNGGFPKSEALHCSLNMVNSTEIS